MTPRLNDYRPHPIQRTFHKSTAKRRWFAGGRQSGKTEAGAAEAAKCAIWRFPGGTGAIFAPTYNHSQVAEARFNEFIPYELREYHGGRKQWKVRSIDGTESTVYLRHSDPDAPRGLVLDWCWLDEAAMYPDGFWDNLRPALAVRRGILFGTSTPRGRNWMWKQAIQRGEDYDVLIRCSSVDNPAYPLEEWEAVKARYGEDSPFFKQEHLGSFVAFIGQAIPAFDRTKHVQPASYNPDWPVVRGWDFGWTAPTVAVWAQITPDEDVILLGCKLWTETRRTRILGELSMDGVPPLAPEFEAIDPAGASARAAEAGDRGWRDAMEAKKLDVRWTRTVSETRRLNLIREWVGQGKLFVARNGPGAQDLIEAFETGELDANPEKDRLKENQHPQADILDAVGYIFANKFGKRPEPRVSLV